MMLVDHTGWKLRRKQWTGTTDQLIEDLEAAYDNAPNMFSIRIHHGGKFQRYPGRMYVSGRVDIFDTVDIDLFTVVALNMMVLKLGYTGKSEPMFYNYLRPLTSLDKGLYALACKENVRCLDTLVKSFKLIDVYIEHDVTALDSYLRAPRFRAILEEISDEPGSIVVNRIEKMLLLTWHESSETTKEPVCDSVTPSSLSQHDSSTPCKDSVCESITPRCMPNCILTLPTDESFSDINLSFVSQQATASQVIDDVMRQLSFDETELDGEAGFADVAGSGVDSSRLSHDESFGVDDLDLNLNEPVNLNFSQVKTQSELPVFEELDVGRTQEHILAEVSTQEPIVAEVSTQEPIVAEVSTELPIMEEVGTQEFSVEDVVLEDYVSSEEDAEQSNGTYDDDDVDKDFLVDEENEIVEPDVDFHLFGISMDLLFDNICVTNLVSDDVLEGEDVDVINTDGFDSDPGNDEEKNYRKRRLAELRTEMKGVKNASGQWKYSFYTGQKFTTPKEAKDRVYLHSIESRRNLKLYKNDGVRIRATCDGKVPVFTMSQGTGPTGPNHGMEVRPIGSSCPSTRSKRKGRIQISMSKAFRAKAKAKRDIRGDHVLQYSMLRDNVVELQSTNLNTTIKIAVERNNDPSLPTRVFQRIYVCLGALKLDFRACRRDMLGLDGAFMKGPFPGQVLVAVGLDSNNEIYPLAYALVEAESKSSWCWFLQCLGDDIDLHLNLNFTFISDRQKGIILAIKVVYLSVEHRYCLRHIYENMKQRWCGQPYKDLLWRAASATNVKDFEMNPKAHEWDKPVITLLEYIREYCMKRIVNVQGVIDKCTGPLTPTATRIMESIKKEAHLMKVQWNGANKYQVSGSLGDQCVVDVVSMTCSCRKWELTGIPCKHVVAACWNMALNDRAAPPPETWVGRPRKKRKRSKHEDEPFVKDGKLSRKGRTITCQSCGNTGHNKATCKGQGRKATTGGNNAEASGSVSGQAQQIEPVVGQDGLGGSGAGAVIGLSAAAGEGGVGVASQGSSHSRWTKRIVQTERISPQKRTPTQPARQPSTSSQVPVSKTRNANGREMGVGVPTTGQSQQGHK
ncbi:heat stress transcription factor B-4-like protein [Tanacetum coccineum]